MCNGGVCQPVARCRSHDVESSNTGTIRDGITSEMMSIGVGHVVFPAEEIAKLSMTPRAQQAATYMAAMGLWRPPSGPGAPGPVSTSSCASCMNTAFLEENRMCSSYV